MTTGWPSPTPADLVAAAAGIRPEAPALIGPDRTLTYRELDERVRRLSTGLTERGIERVACVAADPMSMAEVFIAASRAGVEVCAYPASADTREIRRLLEAFDHKQVISPGPGSRPGDLPVDTIAIDQLLAKEWGEAPARESAPVLVLTTGTTGRPKGARHDWRRLTHAASRWSSPTDSRWMLTYNLNQFAGIQVLVHVLVSQAALVIPAALQARTAMSAMGDHEVTHASATPTFWRQVLNQSSEGRELPRLVQITIGGERVPGDLLRNLQARFPDARISQVYASTEFGSSVAIQDRDNGLPLSVLERGSDADVQMRVVEGELQVRSRVGMLGYHGEKNVGDEWRPTGDLVDIRGGRLQFIGRAAEVINVGGVKVHPADVEDRVLEVPGVLGAHAKGRANPVTGQIVQLEVVTHPEADSEELEDRIRTACSGLPDAAQPRRIRFVDELQVREHKIPRGGSAS